MAGKPIPAITTPSFAMQDFQAQSSVEAIAAARKLALEQKAKGFELWESTRYLHGEQLLGPRAV
jgi:hypothetical protein